MKLSSIINDQMIYNGKIIKLKYYDVDSFSGLDLNKCKQIYGVCFCKDKMLVVLNGKKNTWGLVGGTIEKGESIEKALIREIEEESMMKVEKWQPIGVQEITEPGGNMYYQLRAFCVVSPIGKFISDPAGSIIEVKQIDPKEYKKYFNWRKIGEKIIQRALTLKGMLE